MEVLKKKHINTYHYDFVIKQRITLMQNISLWKNYFQQASGFVFVVDSIYRERIEDAKSFIYMVMDEVTQTSLASCI